jgi:Protein of unknown function (DUF1769)
MNVVHIADSPSTSFPHLSRLSESTPYPDRRRTLSSHSVRSSTPFPSKFVAGDFSNPFVDFNDFSVTLPYVGLKVDVLKYWLRGTKRQPLRYVCRLRPKEGREETVFFVVVFELVGDGVVEEQDELQGVNLNGVEGTKDITKRETKERTKGANGSKDCATDSGIQNGRGYLMELVNRA